ncbi:hypothetical protein [Kitasatospora kazusensis]
MKFCEFFGGGQNIHPSKLADGWNMPHQLHPTREVWQGLVRRF